jgi:restriction system protein
MRQYLRIILGRKSEHVVECYNGNFIGADYDIDHDLTNHLPDDWKEFNHKYIPVWLEKHPQKSKIAAGISCGALWTISKGIKIGDIVLCFDGDKSYFVGEVVSNYHYQPGGILPHRRTVKWYSQKIEKSSMTEPLRISAGSRGTVIDISKYGSEIETLISGAKPPVIVSTDESIEDPTVFALEKHLESFLVENWKQTELDKNYDIFEEDGELVGQQYPSDTGPIDILAVSKDKKILLVVELKKGRVSDSVVGQIQRYMGYVKDELAEANQEVKGVIIALEDDLRIRRALSVAGNIEFYRYQVNFKLFKN